MGRDTESRKIVDAIPVMPMDNDGIDEMQYRATGKARHLLYR